MRVNCPFCHQKARIGSRHDLNEQKTISDLYCQCLNVANCGATFTYTLSYKHVINPPVTTYLQTALDLVSRLSKDEKAKLQHDMFNS